MSSPCYFVARGLPDDDIMFPDFPGTRGIAKQYFYSSKFLLSMVIELEQQYRPRQEGIGIEVRAGRMWIGQYVQSAIELICIDYYILTA